MSYRKRTWGLAAGLILGVSLGLGLAGCASNQSGITVDAPGNATAIPTVAASRNYTLTLTLKASQAAYKLGETLPVQLTVVNAGPDEAILNTSLAINAPQTSAELGRVFFVVTGPDGKELAFSQEITSAALKPEMYKALAAGQQLEGSYQLDKYYAFTQTGTYTVYAVYQNSLDPGDGRSAWKGQLQSAPLEVTLEP